MGPESAIAFLEGALRERPASEADEVELSLVATRTNPTRLANSQVIQSGYIEDAALSVRVAREGAIGAARTNDLSPDGVRAALTRAVASSAAVGGGRFPGFPRGGALPAVVGAFDARTAMLDAGDKSAALSPALQAARAAGVLLAGSAHTSAQTVAVANSVGLRRVHQGTTANIRLHALDGLLPGDASAYAGQLATALGDVDLRALADDAIARCQQGRGAVDVPVGSYDVLLEPEAVAELLEWLGVVGFASGAVERGESFLVGRLGDTVTGPAVTIIDDGPGSLGHGIPLPFDAEGTAKRPLTLIEAGVARCGVTDAASGARLGVASTGHLPFGSDDGQAAPTQLVMLPGTLDREALLSRLDDGLWIHRLHYVNGNLEPRRAVMTGLTRDGVFRVRGGRVQHAVRRLRFTDAMLDAFARIDGVSADVRTTPTWWSALGAVTAPAVLIRGLRFTGGG